MDCDRWRDRTACPDVQETFGEGWAEAPTASGTKANTGMEGERCSWIIPTHLSQGSGFLRDQTVLFRARNQAQASLMGPPLNYKEMNCIHTDKNRHTHTHTYAHIHKGTEHMPTHVFICTHMRFRNTCTNTYNPVRECMQTYSSGPEGSTCIKAATQWPSFPSPRSPYL